MGRANRQEVGIPSSTASAACPPGRLPLVPRLGPSPPGIAWLGPFSLLLAFVLTLPASARPDRWLLGGPPDLPGLSHTASQIAARGPGAWAHSRLIMFPSAHNLYAEFSFPADGALAAPLVRLLGWPMGFTVFGVLVLGLCGATAGWLAGRWWRSLPAALLASALMQSSGIVLREIHEGRLTHVLGLVFAPLAVAAWSEAMVRGQGRYAFLAGIWVGVSALVFWYQAVWVGLLLLPLALAGAWERLPVLRPMAFGAAGTLFIAGMPLVFTVLHAGAHPGSHVGLFDLVEEIPGQPMSLLSLQESRDIGGMGLSTGAWALRPLLLLLVLLGLRAGPPRRLALPVAALLIGWLLGEGPMWQLPGARIFSPVVLQGFLPLMRRYWWPDRYLLVASLGAALLASGGALVLARRVGGRLRGLLLALLALALLTEARLRLPTLPLAHTPAPDPVRVAALREGGGPLLVVPMRDLDPEARNKVWASEVLLEQIAHGRPLLAGPMNPEGVVAGELYRAFWSGGLLRAIRACDGGIPAVEHDLTWEEDLARSKAQLYRLGLREILADPRYEHTGNVALAWRLCLEELLGPPVGERGPFRVYALAAPIRSAPPPGSPAAGESPGESPAPPTSPASP